MPRPTGSHAPPPLPRCYKLNAVRLDHALACLKEEVAASPVFAFLGFEVRKGHGRFYFLHHGERVARVTPAGRVRRSLELHDGKQWFVVAMEASEREVVRALATNDLGLGHRLASLERALRQAALEQQALARIAEQVDDDFVIEFVRSEPDECAARRCLYRWGEHGWEERAFHE